MKTLGKEVRMRWQKLGQTSQDSKFVETPSISSRQSVIGLGAVVRGWDDVVLRTVIATTTDRIECAWFDKLAHLRFQKFDRNLMRVVAAPDSSEVAHLPAPKVKLRSGGPEMSVLRCDPKACDGRVFLKWEHPNGISREVNVPVQALVHPG